MFEALMLSEVGTVMQDVFLLIKYIITFSHGRINDDV